MLCRRGAGMQDHLYQHKCTDPAALSRPPAEHVIGTNGFSSVWGSGKTYP